MKAIILCAGFGTRLKPITDNIPKPLINILNLPLLQYILEYLKSLGFVDILINRYHLIEKFEKLVIPEGLNVIFSDEKEILGTAGGILSFKQHLDEDFLVVNGDILFSLDIEKLLSSHKESKSIATMVLRDKDIEGVSSIYVDDFNNVAGIGGKKSNIYKEYMFTGVHVFSPEVFENINLVAPPSCIVREFYMPYLSSIKKVNSYVMENNDLWLEFGNHETYLKGNLRFLDLLSKYKLNNDYGPLLSDYWHKKAEGERINEVVENIWLGDDSYVDSGATIYSPVFIGKNSRLERGSRVGPNVILGDNVIVGQNTEIRDSMIYDEIKVGEGLDIRDSLILKELNYKSKVDKKD